MIEVLDPLTTLVRTAQISQADDVLHVVADLLPGVGVEYVHHAAVVESETTGAADLDDLTGFGEIIAARLLIYRQMQHQSDLFGIVSPVNDSAHDRPPTLTIIDRRSFWPPPNPHNNRLEAFGTPPTTHIPPGVSRPYPHSSRSGAGADQPPSAESLSFQGPRGLSSGWSTRAPKNSRCAPTISRNSPCRSR